MSIIEKFTRTKTMIKRVLNYVLLAWDVLGGVLPET